MSTSGGTWVNALLLVLVIVLAAQTGVLLGGRPPRVTPVAVGLWLVVAIPSLLQFPFPVVLRALRRDPELIRQHGQVWRMLTSVVVQDGGGPGTASNLVFLAVVAVCAAGVWGPVLTPVIFVLGHLAFNTAAVFLSPDVGAGNSGATLGLGASLAALALVTRSEIPLRARATGVIGAGTALLLIGDAHGIAVLGGAVIGVLAAVASGRAPNLWQTRRHAPG